MGTKDYLGIIWFSIILVVTPFIIGNDYYIGILVFAAFNCLSCIGLSLLMGYAGQISLGHAAFLGIGAYSSALLTVKMGWSPWLAIVLGIILAVIMALVIGIPSLRLKGHYLAMATLGFGSIIHIVTVAAVDFTGGPAGISQIPTLNIFGFPINSDVKYYAFIWIIVVIGLFFALNIIHSRSGRALRAIHGSEDAAGSSGIHTSRYKIRIFVISAIYSSIAGSFYAHYVNYIDPGPFGIMHSVLLVTMVAVGGMHKVWGAVIGSILLSVLPEILSTISEVVEGYGIEYKPDYDTLIYGSILLAIMLFLPGGIFQGVGDGFKRLKKLFTRKTSSAV
ncbi:MAG: branched-chain amino acid ABC transporter permease [Proteobacteria bacterium]|nr:branched-chain amino acid ABC transporter permease [Pseudomonadota bacterium]